MAKQTRNQLLEIAQHHFADKGFEGTSIAGIAEELDLTKQALLHHFGSKEKLYGEVLRQICDRSLSSLIQTEGATSNPLGQLESLLIDRLNDNSDWGRLVMRELLDNRSRAEGVRNWYLKPFIDALVAMVKKIPRDEPLGDIQALSLVFQLLGAINYFIVSETTLSGMFGNRTFNQVKVGYPEELRKLIRARFA